MTRQEYIDVLRCSAYLQNPTDEQIVAVCPHLEPEQVLHALQHSYRYGGSIALPPVLVRGAVRIASYYKKDDRSSDQPAMLYGGRYVYRGRKSFADGKPHGAQTVDYRFFDEALAYAEEHWGGELVDDDWQEVQLTELQYSDRITDADGEPLAVTRVAAIITSSLNLKWNKICDDPAIPAPMLWNDAIITATTDQILSAEIRRPHYNAVSYNCARCGGALSVDGCESCGSRLPYNRKRSARSLPLPLTIIKLLRDQGHRFELDPERLLESGRPVG